MYASPKSLATPSPCTYNPASANWASASPCSGGLAEPLHRFGGARRIALRSITSDDPIEVVVSEAQRNYDLVVLGASESFGLEPSPFGARHERIARECPASLVVRRYERAELRRAPGA